MSKSAEKRPPSFLPFGEILGSYRSTWHNFTHRYFMHHWTSLWFLWQKSPPPTWGKIFWLQIYPFQAISSNFGFCGRKAPPPPHMRENFLTSDLSISGNFEQLWFLWQKSPPPTWGKIFLLKNYPFQAILSNFGFCGRKAPPPTHPTHMRENFLTSDLSISGNFEQLWFLWQKSPPPPTWGKIFWLQIYPFQAIWSNFGFCGRKAPSPKLRENFFDFRFIHFRQFRATLVFVAEKPIPTWGKFFWLQIYPFQAISSNFGFCGRKAPPTHMMENFLTSDLSISGNFEQLWFLWQKSPPPNWGKIFDFRFIHFRQFRATLVFVAEKPPPPHEGKFFDFRFIHFRQF